MSKPDDEHSVFNEPHLRPDEPSPDSSEYRAERTLSKEPRPLEGDCRDGLSVYDEPDIFPGRAAEQIDQDWSCGKCGYNLRGLPTGHRCPECGSIELYRPAGKDVPSYQNWLRQRIESTSPQKAWLVAIAAALLGGPWAVLAALTHTSPGLPAGQTVLVLALVFGPVVEEVMKIGTAACVVEVRPYLFRRVEQVQIATVGSALLFAVIENIIYLKVYIPNPSIELMLWRWTACVALHIGCTLISTRGLVRVWQRVITEHRPPRLTDGFSALVTAIVLHSSYNAAAILFSVVVP